MTGVQTCALPISNHDLFADGLRKSLFNYMHGVCFEFPLQQWFDFEIPATSIPPDYVETSIGQVPDKSPRPNALIVWLGNPPTIDVFDVKRGRKTEQLTVLTFYGKQHDWTLELDAKTGQWLSEAMKKLIPGPHEPMPYQQLIADYEAAHPGDSVAFTESSAWQQLRENGMLVL